MRLKYARPPHPHAYGPRGPPPVVKKKKRPQEHKATREMVGAQEYVQAAPQTTQEATKRAPEKDWGLLVGPGRVRRPTEAHTGTASHNYYDIAHFYHLLPPGAQPSPSFLLTNFLTSHPDTSPRRYNAGAIIALYHAARHSDSRTNTMTERHYSLLIALFGALSVLTSAYEFMLLPRSATPSALLVQMIPSSYGAEHWRFISLVVKDKQAAGYSLGLIDNYWLMRGALAEVDAIPVEGA